MQNTREIEMLKSALEISQAKNTFLENELKIYREENNAVYEMLFTLLEKSKMIIGVNA